MSPRARNLGQILPILRRTGHILTSRKAPLKAKLLLLGGLAYLIWPLDLLPDWLTIPGLLDDFAIAILAITLALRLVGPEGQEDREPKK